MVGELNATAQSTAASVQATHTNVVNIGVTVGGCVAPRKEDYYEVIYKYENADRGSGVLFLRASSSSKDLTYMEDTCLKTLKGSVHDCTPPGNSECTKLYGLGTDKDLTYAFELKPDDMVKIYIPRDAIVIGFSSWIQPKASLLNPVRSMIKGPQWVTQMELTIDDINQLYMDISSVEGYSADVNVKFWNGANIKNPMPVPDIEMEDRCCVGIRTDRS